MLLVPPFQFCRMLTIPHELGLVSTLHKTAEEQTQCVLLVHLYTYLIQRALKNDQKTTNESYFSYLCYKQALPQMQLLFATQVVLVSLSSFSL